MLIRAVEARLNTRLFWADMWQFAVGVLLSLQAFCLVASDAVPLEAAHAHNDYEHDRPLLDALDQGFTSVEADIYLIDGVLYVYHDRPWKPDPGRTLEQLYLRPLHARAKAGGGRIYPADDHLFYLMIDLKTKFEPTYEALINQLEDYESMIARVIDDEVESDKAVRVFLSGTASSNVEAFLDQPLLLASVDGRPEHLGQGISAAVMPVVSQRYSKISKWRGRGEPRDHDISRLKAFVSAAHDEGKRVRLWAAPDNAAGWQFLQVHGVDLINTDDLPGLSLFLREQAQQRIRYGK